MQHDSSLADMDKDFRAEHSADRLLGMMALAAGRGGGGSPNTAKPPQTQSGVGTAGAAKPGVAAGQAGANAAGSLSANSNRNITNSSQLDNNMLSGLKNEGIISSGGRSGGARPLTGTPNSFVTTQGGHRLVYDSSGRLIFDISPDRVKMTVWDQAPGGQFFPRDVKLPGAVPNGLIP